MNDILDQPMDRENTEKAKIRHGCLTAWLIFGIITNSITALAYILFKDIIMDEIPGTAATSWMMMTLGGISFLNVLSCILLLKWKKLGFWIFIATSFAALGINLMMGISIAQCGFGLFGVFLLYVILQIKEKNLTAWKQMD